MNASSRDGFVTMVSAFVATVFYGVPLVVAALAAGPWVPEAPVDGDEAVEEAGTVRMFLPLVEPEPEEEVAPEAEVAAPVRNDAPPDAGDAPPDAGPVVEEGPAAPVDGPEGQQVAGEGEAGEGTGAKTVRPATPGRSGGGKARRQKACDNPHPNIHPHDGMVDIDRSLVDKYTKNLETFMSLGYSHPYDEGGVHGWYIGGFSCTSPVHKAGFRRGDVLLSVNGKNTRSWIGVYLLYQKLKNKQDFDIQVVRKGAPVTLKFRIIPG